jgi:hypothetical protein
MWTQHRKLLIGIVMVLEHELNRIFGYNLTLPNSFVCIININSNLNLNSRQNIYFIYKLSRLHYHFHSVYEVVEVGKGPY